jgi:hypothetical protein
MNRGFNAAVDAMEVFELGELLKLFGNGLETAADFYMEEGYKGYCITGAGRDWHLSDLGKVRAAVKAIARECGYMPTVADPERYHGYGLLMGAVGTAQAEPKTRRKGKAA